MAQKNISVDTHNSPIIYQATKALEVTPDDDTILPAGTLYVGTGGNLTVLLRHNTTPVTFVNIPDGIFLPMIVIQVYASTTASDILLLT